MDDIHTDELFGSMKKGKKKKRASKKACVESEVARTEVAIPEPEQPPMIYLVGDSGKPIPPRMHEEATSLEPILVAATSSGSDSPIRSILTPKFSLLKSKDAVFAEEVARWANFPVAQLGARAATHCMVVKSSIHDLAYQSEVNLKQVLKAEESSRNAHAELNLARNEINQLKIDTQATKELLTLLMSEKKELEERETALKRELEDLEPV
ncbi:PREDICTED: uncharacterized protein LOC104587690 [Nelumbo nucifera]|uniref:Uncharacterized protein LOC104587690 n=1 Tax=Nelumbo nucifera TaxID=4432 RepID=A0A1U7YTN9_NELNU|nr:PREDICTED: uncharacterized protein LOC104587690 [Nelumbo nucifera]